VSFQATEVIKMILGKGEPLIGRLLLVDALAMRFRELKLRKNPECPSAGRIQQLQDSLTTSSSAAVAPETTRRKP